MTNYKEILQLHSLGINNIRIAESCGCARSTVIAALQRAAEQEQRPLKQVHLELGFYQIVQPINTSPQICVSAGDIHRVAAVKIVQHDFAAWKFACSVAPSAPL